MTNLTDIPAIACTLSKGYLIEASAGTGKTWTLTGIILRLLIEKKYTPERIIATTFTRASASEMQERIQARISSFYRYVSWLNGQKATHAHWFHHAQDTDSDTARDSNETWGQIVEQAGVAGIADHDDPINEHLIKQLITDSDPNALTLAIRRCSLLLATLDKLFVGTLDSLAQKWLKEFADQIGHQMNTELSTSSNELTCALIHDALRREHVRVAQLPLYALIDKAVFSDVGSAHQAVTVALNFYDAPIDTMVSVDDYLAMLDKRLMSVFEIISVFEPFYELDYMLAFGFKNVGTAIKEFGRLKNIMEMIKVHHLDFVNHISDEDKSFLDKLEDIKKETNFKKGFENNKQAFLALPLDKLLIIRETVTAIKEIADYYKSHLYQTIAKDVRVLLKSTLERQHKSTFTFQMVRLIEALEHGPELARHIRHHYPVALIDESQDINGLQKRLIELVYLDYFKERRDKGKSSTGFLLLVGDPKQAIYRFRGGDVANYNSIKHYGQTDILPPLLNSELTLTTNRRSNSELIDSLNHWFVHQDNAHSPAYLGDGIYYQSITAHKEQSLLSWQYLNKPALPDYLGHKPLTLLHLPYKKDDDNKKLDKYQYIAHHINSLLQGGHTLDDKKIKPDDIAVLARTKKDLAQLKKQLDKLGIPSISPNDINVFTTESAKDLYALLTAMISQEREILGRLFITQLFGYELREVTDLLNDEQIIQSVVFHLKECHQRFLKYGIASALTYALLNHPLSDDNLWQTSAKAGERYLADLWQLTELIGREYTYQDNNEIKLMNWLADKMTRQDDNEDYQQMILPSESGVNLMTIHKSKGLEFPIVYVMNLDDPATSKNHKDMFYAYSDERYNRRISPIKDKVADNEIISDYYKIKQNQELLDERLRVGYVALTRASEQTFVVGQDLYNAGQIDERPLFLWFDCKQKDIILPERLTDKVDVIDLAKSEQLITDNYQDDDVVLTPIHYQPWQVVFAKAYFYGASKTSATALMSVFNKPSVIDDDNAIDDEIAIIPQMATLMDDIIPYPENDIRSLFEKGVNAGTFLHNLLQFIDPNDKNNISSRIDDEIRQLNFAHAYHSSHGDIPHESNDELANELVNQAVLNHHQALVEWLYDISHTPFLSSKISLSALAPNRLAKEMSFTLRLTESFNINELNEIFKAHSDKEIILTEQNPSAYYKYLNGEIDLVYEHQGKFYVVDYKSNFIGESLSHYRHDSLESAMNKAGYWLQACVYQVALHRLLKLRIKDYVGREEQYLGAVEFVFLRGVDKHDPTLGHIAWQVPLPLIYALNKLFG
ncbi:UvrD-helicase domain-containing protein [Moraxella bovis]|uniref:UvrD-helicase domain-containing protein n=1 Tax=Moraxella bovis TaxID=476 RepID=UPI0022278355|nr:UvrD-helicase domain-containing protein [Moraxella bovis]UYZ88303.1 UvrD-helicase domain-containing protein [Moraxella bovis]